MESNTESGLRVSLPVMDWVQKLWDGGEGFDRFLDVTLHVGETFTVKAHMSVLAAAVPLFEEKFTQDTKEAATGEVHFKSDVISVEGLQAILKIVYGQEVTVDEKNVEQIHAAAAHFKLESVAQTCLKFMKENLMVGNVISFWQYAHREFTGAQELLQVCTDFIKKHFSDVYKDEPFIGLEFQKLMALLSTKDIEVSGENDVLDAVMMWLNKDWGSRFQDVEMLNKLVLWSKVDFSKSFELNSVKEFRARKFTNQVQKDAQIEILRMLAGPPSEEISVGISRSYIDNSEIEPDNRQTEIYCLGQGENGKYFVRIYDTAESCLKDKKELLPFGDVSGRKIEKLFRYGGSPYIFYGKEAEKTTFIVQRLAEEKGLNSIRLAVPSNCDGLDVGDVSADQEGWLCVAMQGTEFALSKVLIYQIGVDVEQDCAIEPTKVLDLLNESSFQTRREASIVIFQGDIYVVGGIDASGYTRSVQIFDIASGVWSSGPELLHEVASPTLLATKNRIIMSGGDCCSIANSAVAYSTKNATRWTYLPPMTISRSGHQMVEAGCYIYVLGAIPESNPNFAYRCKLADTWENGWRVITKLTEVHKDFLFAA